mgnify:FL=1
MKLKLLILSCLLSFSIFADYNLRGSYGFLYNEEISNSALQSGSYEILGEYFIEPLDNISIGFGVAYSWPAEYQSVPTGLNSNPIDSSIPIYGSIIFSILPDSNIEPYLVGRLGYAVINPNKNSTAKNVQGDIYTSLGVGGYYNNFFLEGTYDKTAGYYTLSGKRKDLDFTRFTLRLGYKFDFVNNKKTKLHDLQKEIVLPIKNVEYDNLEKFDEKGNIIEKTGTYQEIEDLQIVE